MYYTFTRNFVLKSVCLLAQNLLDKPVFILRYCSSNLCKWNYLYDDLPFFKIQVNHFMDQDKPFGAKIIPKCILWVRGLVPFWVLRYSFLSLIAQMVKHLLTMWETRVQPLGREDLLKKEMVTHSSILAWKIPWMEEPGRLQSMGSQRVRHDWATSLSVTI